MSPKAMKRGCPPAREGVAGRKEGGKRAVLAASHLGADAGVGEWDLAWLCHPACKPRQKIGFGGPIRQYQAGAQALLPRSVWLWGEDRGGLGAGSGCCFPQAFTEPFPLPFSHQPMCLSFLKTTADTICDIMTYNRKCIFGLRLVPGTNPKILGIS